MQNTLFDPLKKGNGGTTPTSYPGQRLQLDSLKLAETDSKETQSVKTQTRFPIAMEDSTQTGWFEPDRRQLDGTGTEELKRSKQPTRKLPLTGQDTALDQH